MRGPTPALVREIPQSAGSRGTRPTASHSAGRNEKQARMGQCEVWLEKISTKPHLLHGHEHPLSPLGLREDPLIHARPREPPSYKPQRETQRTLRGTGVACSRWVELGTGHNFSDRACAGDRDIGAWMGWRARQQSKANSATGPARAPKKFVQLRCGDGISECCSSNIAWRPTK